VQAAGYSAGLFADDLNCFCGHHRRTPEAAIIRGLKHCQAEVHCWGAANRVVFAPSKEGLHILRRRGTCTSFKLLGVLFDSTLLMHDACKTIGTDAAWRLRTLLRCLVYHSVASMFRLYKTYLLPFCEYATPAIYHASCSALRHVDHIQEKFLEEMQVGAREALLVHNLAPLAARRDIAMLGVLQKCRLGLQLPCISQLFPTTSSVERKFLVINLDRGTAYARIASRAQHVARPCCECGQRVAFPRVAA